MKHLFSSISLFLFASIAANGQCVPGAPCDDADPCTSGDVYTVIPGEVFCAPGSAEFPNPSSNSDWASLSTEDQRLVSPFMHDMVNRRFRKQYMFLASELDVQANQLAGNLLATQGLGTCEPATAIAFYLEVPVTEMDRKHWLGTVTLKHAWESVHDLSMGFENSFDTAAGCGLPELVILPDAANGPGWFTIPLTSSFQWDGVRDVILEVAANVADTNTPGVLPVRFVAIPGEAPFNQLTYSSYAAAPYPPGFPCSPVTPSFNSCNPLNVATAMGDCGTFGSSNLRPSVLFIGGVTTASASGCMCAGTVADSDADGVIDCEDPCPLGLDPGLPCDDGDELTTGDMVGEDCECLGVAMGMGDRTTSAHPTVWPVPCGSTLFLDRMMSGTVIDGRGKQVLVFNKVARLDVGRLAPGPYVLRTAELEVVRFVKE